MYLTKSEVELIQDLVVGSTNVHKVLLLYLYVLSFGRKRHRGRNFKQRLACTADSHEEGTSLPIFAFSLLPSLFELATLELEGKTAFLLIKWFLFILH